MPTCEVDPKALVAMMKTAKAFGQFKEVWLEMGDGKLIFRSGDEIRYAICGVTLPAPGCEGVEPKLLGLIADKLADVVKGVKGNLRIEWDVKESANGGRVTFKNGNKRRSFLLLTKEGGSPVRHVPSFKPEHEPELVKTTLNGDELKRFLAEAENVGYVYAKNAGGKLVLYSNGDTGDELEWVAGDCVGPEGKVAMWNAENWGKLLPSEYDGETWQVTFHPGILKMEWALGGAPCAMAVAPMNEDPGA